VWGYTSTPQYIFMAWCLAKQRDNFTFVLVISGRGISLLNGAYKVHAKVVTKRVNTRHQRGFISMRIAWVSEEQLMHRLCVYNTAMDPKNDKRLQLGDILLTDYVKAFDRVL
jgi:hypothetical protein